MWSGHVILVRHGSTEFNSAAQGERIRGWIDLPLSRKGSQQLGPLKQHLANFPIDHIASSDLQRARLTAEAIHQEHPDVPLTMHAQLRPWHLGIYSGQLVDHVKPLLSHAADHPNDPIPGGESFGQFTQRFLPILHQLINDPRLMTIVTHYRDIAIALVDLHGKPLNDASMQWAHTRTPSPGGALFVTPTDIQYLSGHPDPRSKDP